VVTDCSRIVADYAAARKPMTDASGVQPLQCTLAEIDERYEQARRWVEQQDVT
jgi:hypothetical protein